MRKFTAFAFIAIIAFANICSAELDAEKLSKNNECLTNLQKVNTCGQDANCSSELALAVVCVGLCNLDTSTTKDCAGKCTSTNQVATDFIKQYGDCVSGNVNVNVNTNGNGSGNETSNSQVLKVGGVLLGLLFLLF